MQQRRFAEARQPLEVIRHKIRRMLKARRIHAFDERQQARYDGLRIAEKRYSDALRASGPRQARR